MRKNCFKSRKRDQQQRVQFISNWLRPKLEGRKSAYRAVSENQRADTANDRHAENSQLVEKIKRGL